MRNLSQDVIYKDFISDEIQAHINLWLIVVLGTALSVLSILTNVVNIIIFAYQGLNEGMNFTLFDLAVCDFLAALSVLGFTISYTGLVFYTDKILEVYQLRIVFVWFRCLFADLSTGITLFIAVERCVCVTFPFIFSRYFNIRTTRITIAAWAVFVTVNYIPVFLSFDLAWLEDVYTNTTRLVFVNIPGREMMQDFNNLLLGCVFSLGCQLCILICAVFIARGLRRSSKFRSGIAQVVQGTSKSVRSSLISGKEKRLVKMVYMVSLLYMPTCIPQNFGSLLIAVYPNFRTFYNFQDTVVLVFCVIGTISGFANIFIYWKFNPSYKTSFFRLFSCLRNYDDHRKDGKY